MTALASVAVAGRDTTTSHTLSCLNLGMRDSQSLVCLHRIHTHIPARQREANEPAARPREPPPGLTKVALLWCSGYHTLLG